MRKTILVTLARYHLTGAYPVLNVTAYDPQRHPLIEVTTILVFYNEYRLSLWF